MIFLFDRFKIFRIRKQEQGQKTKTQTTLNQINITVNQMHNFKKLKIWSNSIEYVTEIYKLTAKFPREEVYGLTSQMRRSVVSIPSNIAEGTGRGSDKEFSNFLNYSMGSCFELETQLIIANNVDFINEKDLNFYLNKINSIEKQIFSFKQTLK